MDEEQNEREEPQEEPRTFTQDEVNRIVGRAKAKYKDYDALKEKAEAFDRMQEEGKSELQRATERAQRAEAELSRIEEQREREQAAERIAEDVGVPASVLMHVVAADEDQLRSIAEEMKAAFRPAPVVVETDGIQAGREPQPSATDWLRSTLPPRYQH